jgi:hypothetical protein
MSDLSRSYGFSAPRGQGAVIGPIRRLARAALAAIVREWRIRRDTRRLLEAEPRMLRELGIARADVARLVRQGRDERS